MADVEHAPQTDAREARRTLARLAPQAVGIVDLALLMGQPAAHVADQLVLSGYSAAAVQAARAYMDARRGG